MLGSSKLGSSLLAGLRPLSLASCLGMVWSVISLFLAVIDLLILSGYLRARSGVPKMIDWSSGGGLVVNG